MRLFLVVLWACRDHFRPLLVSRVPLRPQNQALARGLHSRRDSRLRRFRRFFDIQLDWKWLRTRYYALGDEDRALVHQNRPKNEVWGPKNGQDLDT